MRPALEGLSELFVPDPLLERPDSEVRQAQWDADLADSYVAISATMAFRHATANLRSVREALVAKLVAGEDGAEAFRVAITMIDLYLKLPAQAAATGRTAKHWLRGAGDQPAEE